MHIHHKEKNKFYNKSNQWSLSLTEQLRQQFKLQQENIEKQQTKDQKRLMPNLVQPVGFFFNLKRLLHVESR